MEESTVILLAFGILLFINVLSLVLVYVTPYGQEYLKDLKEHSSKGYFVFWNIWMVLFGFYFWPCVGIEKLVQWIKSKKAE